LRVAIAISCSKHIAGAHLGKDLGIEKGRTEWVESWGQEILASAEIAQIREEPRMGLKAWIAKGHYSVGSAIREGPRGGTRRV